MLTNKVTSGDHKKNAKVPRDTPEKQRIRATTGYKFAYRLKNGDFYKQSTRGSWEGSCRKDITTKDLLEAELFSVRLQGPPYDMPCMKGGKWVQVIKKIEATWEDI